MMNLTEPSPDPEEAPKDAVFGLGLVFGLLYFVQGIGEPTEGLISQPVRSLLKGWGHSASEIAGFMAVLGLPWSLKPLYGVLTDFVPLGGSRRRVYLILTCLATAAALGWLWLVPPERGSTEFFLAILLFPTVGVAFSDVVVDALMIEEGKPRGITGTLQSVQWSAMYVATILTGIVGGWLSEHGEEPLGFLLCGLAAVISLGVVVLFVRERPPPENTTSAKEAALLLWTTAKSPVVLGVGAFLFFWNFNPFNQTVLYIFMTKELELTESFYGETVSLLAIGAVVASVAYGMYCRRIGSRTLVHLSIVTGIAATLVYAMLDGKSSAVIASLVAGFTYMTGTLVQLDIAARACPSSAAGTTFALLMALSNLAVSLSTAAGGAMYDAWRSAYDAEGAFQMLVLAGAGSTALCWIVVRYLPYTDEKARTAPAE